MSGTSLSKRMSHKTTYHNRLDHIGLRVKYRNRWIEWLFMTVLLTISRPHFVKFPTCKLHFAKRFPLCHFRMLKGASSQSKAKVLFSKAPHVTAWNVNRVTGTSLWHLSTKECLEVLCSKLLLLWLPFALHPSSSLQFIDNDEQWLHQKAPDWSLQTQHNVWF